MILITALSIVLLAPPDSARDLRIVVAPAETLAVQVAGSGPPVVLLPGILGGAYSFLRLTRLLTAEGYRTIVVMPLGFGTSSRPSHGDYSMPAQVRRVNMVLDSLGVRGAVVVGRSLGGSVALRLAIAYPERVSAIVQLDVGPIEQANTPGLGTAIALAPILKLFGAKRIARNRVANGLRTHSADPSWVTDSVIDAYAGPMMRDLDASLRAAQLMMTSPMGDSLAPQLPKLHAPVLLLVGRANRLGGVVPSDVLLYSRSLPSFAVDTVDRTGEYVQEERPDAVVAAVLRFETAAPGRSPN